MQSGSTASAKQYAHPDQGVFLPGDRLRTVSNRGILGGDPDQTADDFTVLANVNEGETRVTGNFAIHNKTDDFDEDVTGTFDFPVAFQEGACNDLGVCIIDGDDAAVINGTGSVNGEFEAVLRGSAVAKPGFVAYELFPEFDPEHINPTEFPSDGSTFEQRIWVAGALRAVSGYLADANLNDPMLVIAGQKYTLPQTGQLYEFSLFTDPRQSLSFPVTTYDPEVTTTVQNFVAPFATLEGSPFILGDGSNVQVSTLKVLEKDSSVAASRGVWLQTSFYLSDLDGGQEDLLVVVALGEANDNTGLTGERRGGATFSSLALSAPNDGPHISSSDNYIPAAEQERIAFTGDIATIAGANGAHFLGTGAPNLVIGTDTTNGNSPFLDKPLTDDPNDSYSSATYHIGTGSAPQAAPGQASGTFLGYAAGIARTIGGENGDEGALLLSNGPNDVKIVFDAASNTLSAQLITHVIDDGGTQHSECDEYCGDIPISEDKGGMTLVLGDPTNNNEIKGRSAFIDNQHYAAIETPGESTIQSGEHGDHPLIDAPTGYLVSGDQLGVTKYFPETFGADENNNPPPLCTNCDFLKWGTWGARAGFQDFDEFRPTCGR